MLSYLNPLNADFIAELEQKYLADPASVDPSWRYFFDGLSIGNQTVAQATSSSQSISINSSDVNLDFELNVLELIQGYRTQGYLIADINPLERGKKTHPLLTLERFGLKETDLDRPCQVGQMLGLGIVPLRKIIEVLNHYYCSPAAIELGHIEDPPTRSWLQKRVESNFLRKPLSKEEKLRCLTKLTEAEAFESFLHKRFVGQKRFSGEGTDVVVSLLDFIIQQASELGADEILLAMAHRGRLSVLASVFQKDLKQMLAEFSGNYDVNVGDGDVKYHMGFSCDIVSRTGKAVHLSLVPNPSHLEAVNSVLMGITNAKQRVKEDKDKSRTLAIFIHGDAAFSGQGSVYELLNMSDLEGYTIGGGIHIILNNQIGFTTDPKEGRSSPQSSDIGKMFDFPIFRVNADEPEAALRSASLALQYRYKFKRDVLIDLVGYRRYGHNESDEPSFTQPLTYQKIASHPRVREIYAKQLIAEGLLSETQANQLLEDQLQKLDEALDTAKKGKVSPEMAAFGDRWKNLQKPTEKEIFAISKTAVPLDQLHTLGKKLLEIPTNFHPHPKIKRFLEDRREMLEGKRGIDWSLGEALAFATLLCENHKVRLAGQDCERGTFSHRHAVFHDTVSGEKLVLLRHLAQQQASFEIVNSLLSEYAALGFEFGQSMASPNKLTLWEAQFGDFVNSAQVIVDQFLTCSAFKWQRYSGLVLLLPHGYEGQGPEHSSARLERFLTACAQNNIQVCNVTTPAQYFHLLRRQVSRSFRIPLVVMSPKSLLRHPHAISKLEELASGHFHEILDETHSSMKQNAKRLVLCSGKIYYDLLEARDKSSRHVPLIRIEQLYPFPKDKWNHLLAQYSHVQEIIWCQEGPQNMEAWAFISQHLPPLLKKGQTLQYVGRAAQASPADSYLHLHLKEQKRIVEMALGELPTTV